MEHLLKQIRCNNCGKLTDILEKDVNTYKDWKFVNERTHFCPDCVKKFSEFRPDVMSEKVFKVPNLNEACKRQREDVLAKGFDNSNIPTLLMLVVSELSEALEADRNGRYANLEDFDEDRKTWINNNDMPIERKEALYKASYENHIKNSFEEEIADTFLRLMDLAGACRIDIEKHIYYKKIYNSTRTIKHGKKY